MLFADYYICMVLAIVLVSLVFCQEFFCTVFASECPRLVFRHVLKILIEHDNI